MATFAKFQPIEQTGVPALRRVPINIDHIVLILPTQNPKQSLLALSGGMQMPVNHTESEVLQIIDDATSLKYSLSFIPGEVVEAEDAAAV